MQHNKVLIWVFIGFIVLGIYAAMNSSTVDDTKTFSPESFYAGETHDEIDPREQYGIFSSGKLSSAQCNSTMVKGSNIHKCNSNVVWLVDDSTITTDADVADKIVNSCTDPASFFYSPYKDGDMILAPATLVFMNSNVEQTSINEIDIIASMGTDYQITFYNVKCWWCHIGKDDVKTHSTVYGNKGSYSTCSAGNVIGQATANTSVQIKKLNTTTGVYEPYDLAAYYTYGF